MPLTPKKMIALLCKYGFSVISQKGSHVKLYSKYTNITLIVPMHCKTLGKGLENAIMKQAGIKGRKDDEF